MLNPAEGNADAEDNGMGDESMPVYAVFGNPIKHSKSPAIHLEFAHQFNEQLTYRALSVEPQDFEARVHAFFDGGAAGLNITMPFKERAFAMADEVSDRAARARAANWLAPLPGGGLRADTTDGVGMVRDMVANHGWTLAGRRALVIGAGGAVRGVLQPLLRESPASLTVVNRTAERAEQLAADFSSDNNVAVSGGGFESIEGETFDLIINGTGASLKGEMLALPGVQLSDRCCCYDMGYGSEPTPFMRWAASQAAWAVADGLGMLVEQAAESFYLWRGKRPETTSVIQHLRQQMES
jgi:shikimate dehydrogenase